MADGEKKQVSIEHLEWAIQSRARNQQTCLRLLRSFERHEKRWQTKKYAPIAQDLLAVAFSLWRAAFLADRKGTADAPSGQLWWAGRTKFCPYADPHRHP
jgi:hypothetical protein